MPKLTLIQHLYALIIFRIPWRIRAVVSVKKIYNYLAHRTGADLGKNVRFNGPFFGLSSHVCVKEGASFNHNVRFIGGGRVSVGRYVHVAQNVTFISSNHDYDNGEAIPYGRKKVNREIVIEDFVWIGHGVLVMPGVVIGEGSVVAAGSVVTRSVEPCAVAGGNPAIVIKSRDIDHFNTLKSSGRYY